MTRWGLTSPIFDEARIASAELTEPQSATLRADLVVELSAGSRTVAAIVVEVQLRPDRQKRMIWPVYVASARLALGCPVLLLVVAPDEAVRCWAQQPMLLGDPGYVLTPLVLSPHPR